MFFLSHLLIISNSFSPLSLGWTERSTRRSSDRARRSKIDFEASQFTDVHNYRYVYSYPKSLVFSLLNFYFFFLWWYSWFLYVIFSLVFIGSLRLHGMWLENLHQVIWILRIGFMLLLLLTFMFSGMQIFAQFAISLYIFSVCNLNNGSLFNPFGIDLGFKKLFLWMLVMCWAQKTMAQLGNG